MRGVYAHPLHDFGVRLRAVVARIPDAVIAGEAAMAVTMGTQPPPVIEVCAPTFHMPQRGFRFVRRRVPPEQVNRNVMSPVLAAVDLASTDAAWIDLLMREGRATPEHFAAALAASPSRDGNLARRRRVRRTFSHPWSEAERRYHDLFDTARIKGWVANHRLDVDGTRCFLDIAFRAEKLAIEIDGFTTHGNHQAFETDRRRQNLLARHGWTVLRFTWGMLDNPEYVVGTVRATLARLRRQRRSAAYLSQVRYGTNSA